MIVAQFDSFGPIGGAVSPDAPAAKPPQKAPDTDPEKIEIILLPESSKGENPPPPGEQPSPWRKCPSSAKCSSSIWRATPREQPPPQ